MRSKDIEPGNCKTRSPNNPSSNDVHTELQPSSGVEAADDLTLLAGWVAGPAVCRALNDTLPSLEAGEVQITQTRDAHQGVHRPHALHPAAGGVDHLRRPGTHCRHNGRVCDSCGGL